MSASNPTAVPVESHPYGFPMGTIRGFLSVLICSFFWIFLLSSGLQSPHPPLAHFFLLSLVFLAFASHPIHDAETSSFLPWLMKAIFVGGSLAVLGFTAYKDPSQVGVRLTPNAEEIGQWPVLLGCFSGGFGIALVVRSILGRRSEVFQTIRSWLAVIAILLLLFETLFQFLIIPEMSDKPSQEVLKIWEGFLVATVAAYFGSRA